MHSLKLDFYYLQIVRLKTNLIILIIYIQFIYMCVLCTHSHFCSELPLFSPELHYCSIL